MKSNIGHTEAAAGVAGIIKAVLALQHGADSRRASTSTSRTRTSRGRDLPVKVAVDADAMAAARAARRIAGVSSFGISGTNAHVVLEEAPRSVAPARAPRAQRS